MILQPNVVGVPNPVPSADSRPYWDGCAAGELRIQRCASCGHVNVLPSRWCAACAVDELTDGLRLTVMFVPTDHGMVVPFFRPAATAPITVPPTTASPT